jgi:ferritin-like metal-binding protein YciE
LENDKVAKLLHDALQDEKTADKKLSEIAESTINRSAVVMA